MDASLLPKCGRGTHEKEGALAVPNGIEVPKWWRN